MKPVVVLLVVFVMMLVMVAPASAGPPEVITNEVENVYEPYDDTLCPGISISKHEIYTERLTFYYDNQGILKRVLGHVDGIDSFYNIANPGVVLSGHFVVNFELDADFNTLSVTGVPYHITAPGYGTVLVRAGLWESYPDGHIAGKDSLVDPKDVAQFCSILGGG